MSRRQSGVPEGVVDEGEAWNLFFHSLDLLGFVIVAPEIRPHRPSEGGVRRVEPLVVVLYWIGLLKVRFVGQIAPLSDRDDVYRIKTEKSEQGGLIVGAGNPLKIHTLSDLQGHRIVPRQPSAGSQLLLEQHLTAHGFLDDVVFTAAALSEADAALAVQEGKADAAFGLGALAAQYRLAFLPVTDERFDLLIDRRNYFEPPLQALFSFTQTKAFKDKAAELAGYDVSGLGTVRFNGN